MRHADAWTVWRLELRILGNLLTKFKFPRKYILRTLSRVLLCAATFIRFVEPRARARARRTLPAVRKGQIDGGPQSSLGRDGQGHVTVRCRYSCSSATQSDAAMSPTLIARRATSLL
jgi:hypothetical protein